MPVFEYKGIDKNGKDVKGVKEADSEKTLRQLLKKEGIFISKISKGKEEGGAGLSAEVDFQQMFEKINPTDIAIFTRQLATLIKAKIPLSDSLAACVDQVEKPKLRKIIAKLKTDVNEGSSFADSLEGYDDVFGPLFANMVRAGEASGMLEEVLLRLAEFTEGSVKLKQKISSAMMYPIIMVVVGSLILGGLFAYVVPQITQIFQDTGQELPTVTKIIIAISDTLRDWWWLMLIMAIFPYMSFQKWKKTPKGKLSWDRISLKIPIFGPLALMIDVSRFTKTLATLLSSGVPLLTALEITKNVLSNAELMNAVENTKIAVKEGAPLALPLKQSGKFPIMVVHMIAVGEKSGALEEMLKVVAESYEAQVENRISRLTTLLEPLMIVGMGFTIAVIVFAILLPILQMNNFVQ
jgi:general secretion pathway protein F